MAAQNCNDHFPFVCLRENVILVKENKTWEEALEHCRGLSYDMVSVQPGEDHQKVMAYVKLADTDMVGLYLKSVTI